MANKFWDQVQEQNKTAAETRERRRRFRNGVVFVTGTVLAALYIMTRNGFTMIEVNVNDPNMD